MLSSQCQVGGQTVYVTFLVFQQTKYACSTFPECFFQQQKHEIISHAATDIPRMAICIPMGEEAWRPRPLPSVVSSILGKLSHLWDLLYDLCSSGRRGLIKNQ